MKLMADVIGINEEDAYGFKGCSAGAQWIIKDPYADYWEKVYEDCGKLYSMFSRVEAHYKQKHGNDYVPIQKWTAEMWAQLWNMKRFGIQPAISHELDFAFATDDRERFHQVKILHNAGVTKDKKDLFFKGQYVNKDPFNENLSFVNKNKCSYEYVKAIRKVKK
ncbi:hypothetical protein OYT88_12375 [Sporolactobacillus sp. CQH2019]|uniref:hypothetical protein n=1 Tax=Sporolactobacillus sp. CQH2019 TaxID=3023512 RepID=UPI002368EFA6|nr:hypothetical protein [Sporolactobacillus sp. CQH2019]MDD9149337.1 hypothetical protein [Sporolactobacillus sp. CQH2019]